MPSTLCVPVPRAPRLSAWQRVGLSLAEAYKALGVAPRAPLREVKAAYHRVALANHPDKVTSPPGSAAAEEAAIAFMRAHKAFERITESRRAPSPSPPASAGGTGSGSGGGSSSSRASAARASRSGASARKRASGRAGGARASSSSSRAPPRK